MDAIRTGNVDIGRNTPASSYMERMDTPAIGEVMLGRLVGVSQKKLSLMVCR